MFASRPAPGQRADLHPDRDPSALLPPSRAFIHDIGSLTVPPCTEHVARFVMREPVTVTHAQLDAFVPRYPDNHRPAQPLDGRVIDTTGP